MSQKKTCGETKGKIASERERTRDRERAKDMLSNNLLFLFYFLILIWEFALFHSIGLTLLLMCPSIYPWREKKMSVLKYYALNNCYKHTNKTIKRVTFKFYVKKIETIKKTTAHGSLHVNTCMYLCFIYRLN